MSTPKYAILLFGLLAVVAVVLLSLPSPASSEAVLATAAFNNNVQPTDEIIVRFVSGIHSRHPSHLTINSRHNISIILSSIKNSDLLGDTQGVHYHAPIASSEHWELSFSSNGVKLGKADIFFGEYLYFQEKQKEYGVRLTRHAQGEIYEIVYHAMQHLQ